MILKIKNKKIEKFIKFFKKIPQNIGTNLFLALIIAFFVALILAGLIFWKYYLSLKEQETVFYKKEIEFNEKDFYGILNFWQQREKNFQEADFKSYLNPFLID